MFKKTHLILNNSYQLTQIKYQTLEILYNSLETNKNKNRIMIKKTLYQMELNKKFQIGKINNKIIIHLIYVNINKLKKKNKFYKGHLHFSRKKNKSNRKKKNH